MRVTVGPVGHFKPVTNMKPTVSFSQWFCMLPLICQWRETTGRISQSCGSVITLKSVLRLKPHDLSGRKGE